MLTIEGIKKVLEEQYGEITDRGCYINGKWFSLYQINEILTKAA